MIAHDPSIVFASLVSHKVVPWLQSLWLIIGNSSISFNGGQSLSNQSGNSEQEPIPLVSFGSIVTVSGPLLSYPTISTLSPLPILVAHRSSPDMTLPPGAFVAFNKAFSSVTESKMEGKGMGMPASKQEWEPIMRFWSQHLARRQVEGLYEVISGSCS